MTHGTLTKERKGNEKSRSTGHTAVYPTNRAEGQSRRQHPPIPPGAGSPRQQPEKSKHKRRRHRAFWVYKSENFQHKSKYHCNKKVAIFGCLDLESPRFLASAFLGDFCSFLINIPRTLSPLSFLLFTFLITAFQKNTDKTRELREHSFIPSHLFRDQKLY